MALVARTTSFWSEQAKSLVRDAMTRSGLSYAELSNRMSELGESIQADSLRSKVARGTFSAAFLLQVLSACGNEYDIRLRDYNLD